MEAVMLLCDSAEALNGKLYLMGGGFTWYRGTHLNCAVAVRIAVPWNQANRQHSLTLALVDQDGNPVIGPADGNAVRFEGAFEVGRPPGSPAGEDLANPLVMRFQGLPLDPGSYHFDFAVDGTTLATARFRMLSPEG